MNPPVYAGAWKRLPRRLGTARSMYDRLIAWGLLAASTVVSCDEHIYPIFKRLSGLQWVNQGFPRGSVQARHLMSTTCYPGCATTVPQCICEGSQIKRLLTEHAYSPFDQVHLVSAASGRYQHVAGSHWILVGDAGMTFDPLSGWGSAKALVSAAAAVQTVLYGHDYQAVCEELWRAYLMQYRDYDLAEQRWFDTLHENSSPCHPTSVAMHIGCCLQ